MMHQIKRFLGAQAGLFLLLGSLGFAQEKTPANTLKPSIEVDGQLGEWTSIAFSTHKASGLQYAFSNTDSTLFIAIKTLPGDSFGKVMNWGLSLGLNTLGKKNVKQSLTFPTGRPTSLATNRPARGTKPDDKNLIAAFNALGVAGFTDFLDGTLSLQNEFGIRAAIGLPEPQVLACEYAIPLHLIGFNSAKSNIIACQIKLNGLTLPRSTDRPNTTPLAGTATRPGMAINSLLEGSDFWVIVPLNTRNELLNTVK